MIDVVAYTYRMLINKGMTIYFTILLKKEGEHTKNNENHDKTMTALSN